MAEYLRHMEQAGDHWHSSLIRAGIADALRVCLAIPTPRLPLALPNIPAALAARSWMEAADARR
jgi:hypothetical protein